MSELPLDLNRAISSLSSGVPFRPLPLHQRIKTPYTSPYKYLDTIYRHTLNKYSNSTLIYVLGVHGTWQVDLVREIPFFWKYNPV